MDMTCPGPLGVWTSIDNLSAREVADFAQRVEALGYSTLWIPEATGRNPFAIIPWMAAHTDKLVFATGIANIYARDAMSMNSARMTIGEMAPGRFILAMGVSHAPLVSGLRGHEYSTKPVSAMRAYLDAMDQAMYAAPMPADPPPVMLAALRTNMLRLAGERTAGAHPYFVTPTHTRKAREILGEGPWLCPEQKILLESDPDKARGIARKHMAVYLTLPNYLNNLRELGFTDTDFSDGGSDQLVDAIVAWGDLAAIRARVQAHRDAGASQVCIQPLRADGGDGPDVGLLESLAPGRTD
jgi:probable F420-dependent oxidoreductase